MGPPFAYFLTDESETLEGSNGCVSESIPAHQPDSPVSHGCETFCPLIAEGCRRMKEAWYLTPLP